MMKCSECQDEVAGGVHLSQYKFVCLSCYEESQRAYREESAARPYQSEVSFLPSPEKLAERIAAERQRIGDQPHDVGEPTMRGSVLYVPKREAYRSARRGTEGRAL